MSSRNDGIQLSLIFIKVGLTVFLTFTSPGFSAPVLTDCGVWNSRREFEFYGSFVWNYSEELGGSKHEYIDFSCQANAISGDYECKGTKLSLYNIERHNKLDWFDLTHAHSIKVQVSGSLSKIVRISWGDYNFEFFSGGDSINGTVIHHKVGRLTSSCKTGKTIVIDELPQSP